MAHVEVDETELLALRRLSQVASKINSNPEGKKLLEQAHKLIDPQAITPTLDFEARLEAARKEDRDQIAAMRKQLEDDKAEREKTSKLSELNNAIEAGFARLRAAGWQDDGIKKVDEVMREKGIVDVDIAAAYVEKSMPEPQTATPSGGTSWNFMDAVADGEADLKNLIANKGEGTTVDKMARDALSEFRGNQRR